MAMITMYNKKSPDYLLTRGFFTIKTGYYTIKAATNAKIA